MSNFKVTFLLALSLLLIAAYSRGQGCQTTVVVRLENIKGGFFAGQEVTLTSRADGKSYTGKSAVNGEAVVNVPCNEIFDLTISNYTKKEVVESSNLGRTKHTFSYPHDMVQKEKQWAMTPEEEKRADESFASLPDTTTIKGSLMPPPKVNPAYFTLLTIAIRDLYTAPLQNEVVTLTGRKRNKSFRGITDKNGRLLIYVPKGDTYDISFKYNRKYYIVDCPYSKGNSDIRLGFSYMGTKEKEKRMREEKERILAEEKRLKEERERFEKECKSLGLTLEECHRKKIEDYLKGIIGSSDTVIMKSLRRNRWSDKLIVVDVTGSMSPYVAQVAMWYRLNHLKENNLQFVLFNDGNNMPDERKRIGETGGIYYQKSKGVDSLDAFMGRVQALGSGGDGPENNMEALIKGVKMAAPFKELIMIADNHAPVKDISLLSQFSVPVHIILCGTTNSEIWPDYLKIAWKTKGSVHTIEDDIITLAKMSEGQQVKIGGITYKIMGGEFVALPKG
jgi:hypothetical protein